MKYVTVPVADPVRDSGADAANGPPPSADPGVARRRAAGAWTPGQLRAPFPVTVVAW